MNRSSSPSSRWPLVAVLLIVGTFAIYVSHVKKTANAPTAAPVSPPPPAASPAPAGAPAAAPASPALSGPGTFYPSQGHAHWDESRLKDFQYNSNPPTSGPHEEVFADGYISKTPLSKAIQAHLLEHGNVLIQYHCTCPSLVKKLEEISRSFDTYNPQMAMEMGKAVLIAPNPTIGKNKIALTAWTRLEMLGHYDEGAIKAFITAWLGNDRNSRQ
ncbi:MAG: DUF3105 domain-containing protein [Nitrospirae bacterium]|nr:DUF3105 domain-containing protein [Nitrospirota bacterium]